jgi:hypothetical protein
MPDGGVPAEFDTTLTSKVRFVAPLLVNMSERSADLLKYVGGPESFDFRTTKVEWQEDDVWNRRLSHGGLVAAGTVALTVTAAAHRYPVGTILYIPSDIEYCRVIGHADANTLTIARDIYTTATGGAGAVANTAEIIVSGHSMDENDDYVFRPTAIFNFPFNYPQVQQSGIQATFRRQETALLNMRGSDLDYRALDLVAEKFVALEQTVLMGQRFAGTAGVPSASGGLIFYVTSALGAQVVALGGAALTRKDIDDRLQALFYAVGASKMAKTLLCGAWAKRKISSFWSSSERLGPGVTDAGVAVDRINTDFGVVEILLHTSLAVDDMYLINRDQIKVGHHGQYGRPHLEELPPSTVGPRSQKVFYSDTSIIVSGVQSMGRISGFSTVA